MVAPGRVALGGVRGASTADAVFAAQMMDGRAASRGNDARRCPGLPTRGLAILA